jgi:hypothetical protein
MAAMNQNLFPMLRLLCASLILAASAFGQAAPGDQAGAPVSYASMSQLNSMLTQLEQASQTTQLDLAKLRIEKWKTDSDTKRQTQSNIDSIARNLHDALPEIVSELRNSPENVAVTFKLYRNLSALYDVFSAVVESAGAFGSRDEFQALANDLTEFDRARRSIGDRTEDLAGAKEEEIARLRTNLRQAQASISSAPPKKVIVDDAEPTKKPKKKSSSTSSKPPIKPAPKTQ